MAVKKVPFSSRPWERFQDFPGGAWKRFRAVEDASRTYHNQMEEFWEFSVIVILDGVLRKVRHQPGRL